MFRHLAYEPRPPSRRMDNLTHTLVGGVLARAGLRERTPYGTAICLLAANIPDVDIVVGFDTIDYLNYHRHLTHSLFVIPLLALLAVGAVAGAARLLGRTKRVRWGPAFGVAVVVAYSHPLLDFMNTYAIRLWLPFSEEWSSWDTLFVIDPVLWAILAAVLIGCWWLGAERSRYLALLGLVLLAFYCGLNRYWHDRVISVLPTEVIAGEDIVRVAAFPAPWFPTNWIGVVETQTNYYAFELDALELRSVNVSRARRTAKLDGHPAVRAAWKSELGSDYKRFAQYGFARVDERSDSSHVLLADMRFMRNERVGLVCSFELDAAFRVVRSTFGF